MNVREFQECILRIKVASHPSCPHPLLQTSTDYAEYMILANVSPSSCCCCWVHFFGSWRQKIFLSSF